MKVFSEFFWNFALMIKTFQPLVFFFFILLKASFEASTKESIVPFVQKL